MRKRVRHLLSILIISGFVIMALGSEEQKNDEVNEIEGMEVHRILDSAEDFKTNFNHFMSNDLNSDLLVGDVKKSTGKENDTFSIMLNSQIALLLQINKEDESLRSVMMIGQGDGTSKSGLNIMMVMGGIIAAVDPNLSQDERGKILRDIGIFDKDFNISKAEGSTMKNGIKYFINTSDQIGVMFGAQNSND